MCDRQSCGLSQAALADFINQGLLARHIRKMRAVYEPRRTVLVKALQQLGDVDISGDPAGLHLMARLPIADCGLSDAQFVQRAEAVGVGMFGVVPYAQGPMREAMQGRFIFGFGGLANAEIVQAITRLKPLLC